MISSIGRSRIADLVEHRRRLGEPHHALADGAVAIDLARRVGEVHELEAASHPAQPLAGILTDEDRIGQIVDHGDAIVAVALERRHQALGIGQERERHVLDIELGSDPLGVRRQLVQGAEEMPEQALARRRHQRVRLARADDHTWHPEIAGKLQNCVQQAQRVAPHLLGRGRDVHVDVGHVEGDDPQALRRRPARAARGVPPRRSRPATGGPDTSSARSRCIPAPRDAACSPAPYATRYSCRC